jgi:hypothetical protein
LWLKKPIGSLRMHRIRWGVKKDVVPIGSLIDVGAMGRPKKFNREGVLEKALPVFWRRGFADATLHRAIPQDGTLSCPGTARCDSGYGEGGFAVSDLFLLTTAGWRGPRDISRCRSVAANKEEIFSLACVKLKSIRLVPTIGGKRGGNEGDFDRGYGGIDSAEDALSGGDRYDACADPYWTARRLSRLLQSVLVGVPGSALGRGMRLAVDRCSSPQKM